MYGWLSIFIKAFFIEFSAEDYFVDRRKEAREVASMQKNQGKKREMLYFLNTATKSFTKLKRLMQ